ncbi:hypothetical protein NLI96_g6928 [Meripilus lineatus]|uniref:Uncharacterized protein n=1 Tax=Meripilus lineatus TaxID=2056292 RepID=A0AAD5V2E5_9APHY|nr:hypothetical protein NLI96_g6928 [Physisporinus lineatus]
MRTIGTFVAYLAFGLALSPFASAGPSATLTSRADGDLTNPQGAPIKSPNAVYGHPVPRTNAERFRRGLGPAPPKRRNNRSPLKARSSPTPCTVTTGVISVVQDSTNGYLTSTANSFGEYGFTTSLDSALRVSLCPTDDSPFVITPLNGPFLSFPYLGFVTGFANTDPDLKAGSANYAYLTGTILTAAHATPAELPNAFTAASGVAESIESSVWSMDVNGVLSAAWVNRDGSSQTYSLYYVPSSAAFALVGDYNAFSSNFGAAFLATFALVADS